MTINPSDKIVLEGMQFYGYHGVHVEERILGQSFIVDIEIVLDLRPSGLSDDIEDTLSYSVVYAIVKGEVEGPSKSLLESLAEGIAQKVISNDIVISTKVRVRKANPPIKGAVLSTVGIEIYRTRNSDY